MKKFAFLIHPRDTSDVARRFPIAKFLPDRGVNTIIERLRGRFGFTICSRFEPFEKVEGYIIAVLLTGEQMVSSPRKLVHQRILETILFAQDKLEVELIGLGALTASVTNAGRWIIRQPKVRVSITHGDTYATAVAEEGIEKIVTLCGFIPSQVKIAIVGAYGLIGSALTKLLSQKGYQLILAGRNKVKLENLRQELKDLGTENNIYTLIDLEEISDADIVVTATSHPGTLIRPEHLKHGAVVYDIAQPMNVFPDLIKERPDVTKIDGAYVDINGIKLGFDMGPPPKTTFACLAETIMMALEGNNNHCVGEIDLLRVEETRRWAEKYRFSHAPFSCFSKPVPQERFCKISELKQNKVFSTMKT